jgi:outer membrane protein insertion porin family
MTGKIGPTVKVTVQDGKDKFSDRLLNRLLPVKRDGALDYAAIIEGERRLESYYQEKGFFFADATPICSVDPPIGNGSDAQFPNNTEFLCSTLRSAELGQRTVNVTYKVDKNRKLKLQSLRIRGTDELPIDEIRTVLESQEANALGIIPLFGYGPGFTSSVILERDAATIRSLMSELGYRDAQVRVNQGVSPNGEDLIITFQVEPGPPTSVESVTVTGNKSISKGDLTAQIPDLTIGNYSRARVRNAVQKLAKLYSDRGYFDARVTSSITESTPDPPTNERKIKVEFKIENEGRRVVINRLMVTGNEKTKEEAILRTTTLRKGDFLRSADLYLSEQNLYGSDAFDRVEIKPEPAGNAPNGDRLTDVVISVNEQPSRLFVYGGGYSTDLGFNGFFDIRHVNLFRNLWQGGARVRWSQLQQLVQFDFVNPRFMHDGERRYAPLTISLQYQRDSTVTRFFRSAFDKGTYGIVQRIDENGNPIDIYGNRVGSPTINRLSLTAETSRTISRKNRSIVFARYRFEDVRLANIESLLIKDLLTPDSRVRISGPGITFVRDTRVNCSTRVSLLELIAKGEPGDKCRYNATDPTNGDYLTVDYSVSFTQLGANFGFQKFQGNYRKYYTFPKLKNTTVAAQLMIGLANVFASGNRYTDPQFSGLNGILPISERFFAGGSTTLRGFDFEEAGPRVVIAPVGTFLDSNRRPVTLQPFTIPVGGNALAIVNLEARVPISKSVRFVPFYDGGNVFERVGDIFKTGNATASNAAQHNLRAIWTHTAGIGLRLKTPVGGEFAVDYGYLINPPRFFIPQTTGPDAIYRLHQGQFHFRFSQAF